MNVQALKLRILVETNRDSLKNATHMQSEQKIDIRGVTFSPPQKKIHPRI